GCVRRRHDDAIGGLGTVATVVDEDGMRRDGRRRPLAFSRVQRVAVVRREHLQRVALSGPGECVRIGTDEERPGRSLRLAVLADRLCDGDDVRLVEAAAERRAAVPRGPEADPLLRVGGIGLLEIAAQEQLDVDEELARGGLSGEWMCHAPYVGAFASAVYIFRS